MYPSPAENRENLNFYWLFRAISSLYNTCGIMETPTFHKMSHAIAQRRALTHRHTTGHWDSLVIYEGIFIDGLYDQLEWYLWGQSVSVLDHWLSIRTIPAVHCSAQRKQEKRCMNKTVWCIFFFAVFLTGRFWIQSKGQCETFGCHGFFCRTASLSSGMNYSSREQKQLSDNRGRGTVAALCCCGTFSAWGETAAELLGFNSTIVFFVFFQEFLAQCRAITLTRVYALCNSKHP